MPLNEIFTPDELKTFDSFKIALRKTVFKGGWLASAEGLAKVQAHIDDFAQTPNHIHALISMLMDIELHSTDYTNPSFFDNKGDKARKVVYSRAISLLKVAEEKFLLNYYKPMLILHDYLDLLVEQAIAKNNPITSGYTSGSPFGYSRKANKPEPLFPRGVFTTTAYVSPIVVLFPTPYQDQKTYLYGVVSADLVVKDLLKYDWNYERSAGFEIGPTQKLLDCQDKMITVLKEAGKITVEKEKLLRYIETRASQPDTRIFSLGSYNVGRMGKLQAAEKLYHAICGRGKVGVNSIVDTVPALRAGELGGIASQAVARVNQEAETLLANQSAFAEQVCDIEKLNYYMTHCSKAHKNAFLIKILENKSILRKLVTSAENFTRLVRFSKDHAEQFTAIMLNDHGLTKSIVKNCDDLWSVYCCISSSHRGVLFDSLLNSFDLIDQLVVTFDNLTRLVTNFWQYREAILEKVLYYSEILSKVVDGENTFGKTFLPWCREEFPNHSLLGRASAQQEFLTSVATWRSENSKGDIVQAARVFYQARYPITGCPSSLLAKMVPDDLLKTISSYVGNPSSHSAAEAMKLALNSFKRPQLT